MRRPSAAGRVCLSAAVCVALAACAPATPTAPAARRPDVLLITLDTTRADRLGSYGYAPAATPHLDRLARDGVRFERAVSPAPLTLPAHATLLTGRHPFTHGVRNNGHFVLPDDVPTLAGAFAAAGYDTAAFVSAFVLERQFGLARGFAHYDDGLDEPAGAGHDSLALERRGDRTVAAAQAWLAGRGTVTAARPYFLWVHLYDAHEPYAPPAPFREPFAERPYDGEVAFQDAMVGRLLDATGFGGAQSPIVVVAGDHGESLGDHGERTHGLFVYDAALRVPLIAAWPGVLPPHVVTARARLVDVAPTLVDLAIGAGLEGAEGQSLRALLAGAATPDEVPPAYAETLFPQFFMQWAALRAIEAGQWKYIDAPEPELYNLRDDPGEQKNLAATDTARATSLKRALDNMRGAGAGRQASTPLSEDARARLASLGYLSATPAAPATGTAAWPDPKHMVGLYEQLLDGNRALAEGRAPEAGRIARTVLARDPANGFAHLLRGRAALATGQYDEAIRALDTYARAVPGSADAHHWLALAHLRLGNRARALAEEDAALAIDPGHAEAVALRAGLLFSSGRRDEAIASLRAATDRAPARTSLRVELADLLTDAGRYADAETEYRRVLGVRPGDGRALLGLGLVLGATGRPGDALDALTRAVDAAPDVDEPRFARAEVLDQLGRTADARADYAWVAQHSPRPDLRRIAAQKLGR